MTDRSAQFLEQLQDNVYVCDGAMGTMLHARGLAFDRCFEELNLSMPDAIQEVHEAYMEAGAEILETNTFGANVYRLSAYGLAEQCRDINLAGVHLARACAGDRALVAGAMGPLGMRIQPWSDCLPAEARSAFQEQARALAEGGVDLIVLETFYDLGEICEAIAAVRAVCDLPVVAQVTIGNDGCMLSGERPQHFTSKLVEWGADAIGCNCSMGPEAMLETIQRMAAVTNVPLAAQPNAGLPVEMNGRKSYSCSPQDMAEFAVQFIRHGVRLVGGCCGTAPEHIRAIRKAVQEFEVVGQSHMEQVARP